MCAMFRSDRRSLCAFSMSSAAFHTSSSVVDWKAVASAGVTESFSFLNATSNIGSGVGGGAVAMLSALL